jgi:hypothetical protein
MRLQLRCRSSEGAGRSQSCYDGRRDRSRKDEHIAARLLQSVLEPLSAYSLVFYASYLLGMIPLPVSCSEHSRLDYRPRVASSTLGAVLVNYGETLKLIEAIAYSDPRVLCIRYHVGRTTRVARSVYILRPCIQTDYSLLLRTEELTNKISEERLVILV